MMVEGTDNDGSSLTPVLGTVFTVGQALAAGMTIHQLRDGLLETPTRGVRMWSGVAAPWEESVRAVAALEGDHYISHTTAARLWGIWLPPWFTKKDWPLHVTGRKGATGARRRPHVQGHRAVLAAADVVEMDGVRLTSPERTWLDLALLLRDPADLVAAGDSLLQRADGPDRPEGVLGVNPLSSLQSLDAVLARRRRTKGITAARDARELVREGVDSAPESRMRLIIVTAGLPEPTVNRKVQLAPGVHRRPDLSYREWQIAMQYDGFGHAERSQLAQDIVRDDVFAQHDWVTVRAGHDLYTAAGERAFLDRLRRAIRHQTGW